MYILNANNEPEEITGTTFKNLNLKEYDIEELLRKNIDMLCDDEYSMLIVGQQVQNSQNGRSDLTAIDSNGDIVLIEIKRDKKDILHRKEAFEFQAIRYAASYATIKTIEELIQDVFAPYVEKHKDEYSNMGELTSLEFAKRLLDDYFRNNNITSFNSNQRIILVASEYDEETLSAVAWLNKNKVNICCYEIKPYQFNGETIIDIQKILPLLEWDDYFVDLRHRNAPITKSSNKADISRRSLPKINKLLEWGIVQVGDVITDRSKSYRCTLLKDGNVNYDGNTLSLQTWLKQVYGWQSVATYDFSVHEKTGKTLSDLRYEYMKKQEE